MKPNKILIWIGCSIGLGLCVWITGDKFADCADRMIWISCPLVAMWFTEKWCVWEK